MFTFLMFIINNDRLVSALAAGRSANPMRLIEAALDIKISPQAMPLLNRLLAVVTEASQPTSAASIFGTALGVQFLAIVVLVLFSIVVASAVGVLFKLGLKTRWQETLLAAGAALGGTFGMGYLILIYLMPAAG